MELFEYDLTIKKVSKYDTNHLHMYVDDNICYPNVADMEDSSYATFIHEYVHYIQHLTTLFGIRMCDMNHRMYILYRDYIDKHDEIKLPLHLWNSDSKLMSFRRHFAAVAGDRECSHNISAVNVYDCDIDNARKNRTAVKIGVYDFDNEKIIEDGFRFGYFCIIESMAYCIQSIINEDVVLDTIPYHAVGLLLKELLPEYSEDPKMVASICLSSLHWDNPGVGFFEVLKILNERNFNNGLDLYRSIAQDYSVMFRGEETPRFRLVVKFLAELKDSLEQTLGTKLNYYKRVFHSCIHEAGLGTSKLLEVLYEGDIKNKSLFIENLANYYGFPMVDAKNISAIPTRTIQEHPVPYLETACCCGMELIISRVIEVNKERRCRRWPICSMNMYSEPDKCLASEECLDKQWEKTEKCLFTQGLKYYGWDKKHFVIEE